MSLVLLVEQRHGNLVAEGVVGQTSEHIVLDPSSSIEVEGLSRAPRNQEMADDANSWYLQSFVSLYHLERRTVAHCSKRHVSSEYVDSLVALEAQKHTGHRRRLLVPGFAIWRAL